jgi:ABC-type transport system involved in multi-copper enzyme maturation permease subunit
VTFIRLLRWELFKLYRRPSSYIGFILCLVFCAVTLFGFGWTQYKGKEVQGLKLDASQYLNGPFFANFVLNIAFIALLPLVVATVAGSQIAGEAKDGTLRALLVRPPSRAAVFLAKAVASLLWLELVIVFLIALALLVGHVAYGGGDLLVYIWEFKSSGFWRVDASDWPVVFALCALGAGVSLAVIASVALLLSALTDNPVVAHVGTLGGFFISTVLQRLPEQVMGNSFKQLLPTSHMNFWHEVYRWADPSGDGMNRSRVIEDLLWCGGLTAACFAAGLVIFMRRDVTS